MNNTYLNFLEQVCTKDVEALIKAEKNYGDSWKKRGGVGAYMMLVRKIDRLENYLSKASPPFDVFEAIKTDTRAEGVIDDIRDLRRYLILVEAEMISRGENRDEVLKDEPITSFRMPMNAVVTPKKEFVSHGYQPEIDGD